MTIIEEIVEREFTRPLLTHDNKKAKIYQEDELRALLQEAIEPYRVALEEIRTFPRRKFPSEIANAALAAEGE